MMPTFTADVKATFAEIAHAQKGHELGFNVVRAELRDLKGGMSQVVTKTQELESAMEEWTEQEGLETWDEEQEETTPKATRFTPEQARRMGEILIQRQQDEENTMDCGDDAFGAPDGAACGKMHKKTKLADDPSLSNEEEEDDGQGEDDDEEWDSSEADPLPDMDSGSDDDISVPGLSNSEDDTPEKERRKRAKLLKRSKQRNEQR